MILYKSAIIIWSEFDPDGVEIDDLAREAISGDAYCSSVIRTRVIEAESDPDWDGTEFFADPRGGEA